MGKTVIPSDVTACYTEETCRDHNREVALSHLSIEVGHASMDALVNGGDHLRLQFQRVAPWVAAASASAIIGRASKPRVSTCFLIDDYFQRNTDPRRILGELISIAAECGVAIDYLARESGCCVANGVPLAELVAGRLLPEPAPGTNGFRPPTHESGWLPNGKRSPDSDPGQAMQAQEWQPPEEFGKRNHSVFLDVELWTEVNERIRGEGIPPRLWSCAFLAAVWQLLRLGMIRNYGETVVEPLVWPPEAEWPEYWDDLPPVIQLNPRAAPFAAYRAVSIVPHSYLPIEHAVQVILGHLSLDKVVTGQIANREAKEGLPTPLRIVDRTSYVFIEGLYRSPQC